jgi:ATP-dependent DNA helicase RecG
MGIRLNDKVSFLKGVGSQRAAVLAERGIHTVDDLLQYFPFRYEDRIHFTPITALQPGGVYTVSAEVESGGIVRFRRSRHEVYHLLVKDSSGLLHCKFFHGGYLQGRLKRGQRVILHGKVDVDPFRPARLEMINPDLELAGKDDTTDSTEAGRIVPVYEAIGNLSTRVLRRIVYGALQALDEKIADPLPPELIEQYRFPPKHEAVVQLHFPSASEDVRLLNEFRTPAHQRLIFEEFFFYQLGLALRRQQRKGEKGIAFRVREETIREALKRVLPFKPTAAQKRVLAEIAADLERPIPMNRLLQGDVGSGKTIVALEAATIVMENGYQVALMAPTEILAVQHYLSARQTLAKAGYEVALLISGLPPGERAQTRERIRRQQAQFVVGTHALIEPDVEFAKLGLVIVDEQHRFGVLQRKRLMEKGGTRTGEVPDVLVMTATPIPRTLALTLYGDLDVSILDEMPPGRVPVRTRWTSEEHLPGVWEFVRREVESGRQAYVVYPVIEESKQELKAATAEFERLSREVFPDLRIGLLHGRLRREEKDQVMEQFRRNEIQILVSTTVIEVGVDVANATVMVIEHADRFGLAQLHQLRGRIGRGAQSSHCILVAPKQLSEEARVRLETMAQTSDGFAIAEIDLKLRGPGEFFGTRQHGDVQFVLAHPLRDRELLELARREAFALAENPAAEAALRRLLAYLAPRWQRHYALATVG